MFRSTSGFFCFGGMPLILMYLIFLESKIGLENSVNNIVEGGSSLSSMEDNSSFWISKINLERFFKAFDA